MSDSQSEVAIGQGPDAGERNAETSSTGLLRKVILFGILGLGLVALGYDYGIARPAVREAYDKIRAANELSNATAQSTFTNEDVSKLLGKEPTKTTHEGTDMVEMYTWPSGLPGRSHKLWAVYKPGTDVNGAVNLFYRQCVFVYETSKEVAPIAGKIVGQDLSPEEREKWAAMSAADDKEYGETDFGSTEIPAESARRGAPLRPELQEVSEEEELEDASAEEETSE